MMYDDVVEFLKQDSVQELLQEENMDALLHKWLTTGVRNLRPLVKYFNHIGIDPLEYITYVPTCYLFYESPVEVRLPSNIGYLQHNAFYRCSELKRIYLTKNFYATEDYSINRCPSFKEIVYEGTTKEFKKFPHRFCSNDIIVTCSDGTLFMRDGEFLDI